MTINLHVFNIASTYLRISLPGVDQYFEGSLLVEAPRSLDFEQRSIAIAFGSILVVLAVPEKYNLVLRAFGVMYGSMQARGGKAAPKLVWGHTCNRRDQPVSWSAC